MSHKENNVLNSLCKSIKLSNRCNTCFCNKESFCVIKPLITSRNLQKNKTFVVPLFKINTIFLFTYLIFNLPINATYY